MKLDDIQVMRALAIVDQRNRYRALVRRLITELRFARAVARMRDARRRKP